MVQRSEITQARLSATLGLSISSGIVSVIGSTLIIVVLLRSPKKLTSTYRRLVFGMSCMDILHSLSWVFAGLPVPDTGQDMNLRNGIGNTLSCNIQGFMNYTGVMGSVAYDCMLSIYFVMVVVYSKRDENINKTIEPLFHAISVIIPCAAGIFLFATGHFNESGNICWIAPFPLECTAPWALPDKEVECTRGQNAMAYRNYFQIYPLVLTLFIIIVCMLCLTCSIKKQLNKMKKYGSNQFAANVEKRRRESIALDGSSPRVNRRERKVKTSVSPKSRNERKQTFTQAILYVVVLLLTFFFAFLYQTVARKKFWVFLFQVTLLPLLGFFNFFIFIRPRVIMIRQCNPELSYFRAFKTAITSKEVKAPPRRRGSLVGTARRSSHVFFNLGSSDISPGLRSAQTSVGRRSSVMSSDTILAAATAVQEVDEEEEAEEGGGERGGKEEEMDIEIAMDVKTNLGDALAEIDSNFSFSNCTGGSEEKVIDIPSSNSSEAQESKGCLACVTEHEETEEFNLTKDYHNMI